MEKEIKEKGIDGMEHLDYLDKYYQEITEYLESGKTINFNRKGHDYILVRFFEKEMKFEARRKEDDKMGKLPVSSYEVEDIYHKLFKNQKNQNEEKITMKPTKPTKKMKTETPPVNEKTNETAEETAKETSVKKNGKNENKKTINKQTEIVRIIKESKKGINLSTLCEKLIPLNVTSITDKKALEVNIKANIKYLIAKKGINISEKDGKYFLS